MNPPNILSSNAPYSQEAEEATLGAVLVNPSAFLNIASFLKAEDFFLLRHAYIWDALQRLNHRGEPIDYLTISQELRDMNRLDEIGGQAYLTHLINNTPTAVHAEVYGRLVERAAIRRRLMEASDEIRQLALDEEKTVDTVIEEAESKIFAVSDSQLKREFVPLWDALSEYYDRMEILLQERGQTLGIPTGFRALDELLGGFQKSDLLIFAGRPGMGKTSFLLTIAMNVARLGGRVALFTMEMGVEQMVQRLIAMETGINMQKLRLANLTPQENTRFTEAVGRLANLQLYIDDTPALSPLEVRTKARRLAHEHGLDLLIIDYLQLMNGGGKGMESNRVQEISYISRSMKELARELNVPLLSAAQLSRAVEQRQDKRPLLSDLRESGCLAGDTLIYLPNEGTHVPIRALVGKKDFLVTSLNTETWKLEESTVTNAFCTGIKTVYQLETALGRTIQATANHQFLTINGWRRLDELSIEEHIAVPRILNSHHKQTMEDSELALLGHLIGDGCTLPRHAIQYTTIESDLAELVVEFASKLFGEEIAPRITKEPNRTWYQVFLPTTRQITHGVRNPISEWLDDLGIFGLRSYEKSVPRKVFAQPPTSIALFLRHLWATDGCIQMEELRQKSYPTVYYATSSSLLARDVQTLLLSLGINARLKCVSQGEKGREQHHVIVTGHEDLKLFVHKIGAVGRYKQSQLQKVQEYIEDHHSNTNRDIIPNTIWRQFAVPAMASIGMTARQMQSQLGNAYCGTSLYKQNTSRERARKLGDIVQSKEITSLASSDVYWDRIKSIEYCGETDVYDLSVPQNSNFCANLIIAHNSIEQDADAVMFLYRDEVYNPDTTEFPNQGEVILAKHRNGPTGKVSLYFEKSVMKFLDVNMHRVDLSDLE